MSKPRKLFITHAGELAHRLIRAVRPHGLVAAFAGSYARRYGRSGVVDEPHRLRELESTLGRESILVMVTEIHRLMPAALGARKGHPLDPEEAAFAQMFWPEFVTALGRALDWEPDEFASERESFERDLLMYRRWSALNPFPGAPGQRNPDSPFLDRCALLLDPSTMEEARRAAVGFEKELVRAAAKIMGHLGVTSSGRSRPRKSRQPRRAASLKPAQAKKTKAAKHPRGRRRR